MKEKPNIVLYVFYVSLCKILLVLTHTIKMLESKGS